LTQKRKICVVTGSRADFGLLFWILKRIQKDSRLTLQLVVTGSHLSEKFGRTIDDIINSGFDVTARIQSDLEDDSRESTAISMGRMTVGFAQTLGRLEPDILLLLGDRYEMMAAAQTGLILGVMIAHIHGGEVTQGAFDDSIRHAISKSSDIHFVAAEQYRKRVIQLGEHPERVYNVGAPGLENIQKLSRAESDKAINQLGFEIKSPFFLVTVHPETRASVPDNILIGEILNALDSFPNAKILFTAPNADPGNNVIYDEISRWVDKNSHRSLIRNSLGHSLYLSLLAKSDLVLGNSSSGIIEAPAVKTMTVNVGSRQDGRLKATSVIDAEVDADKIAEAISKGIDEESRLNVKAVTSLYGDGDVSSKITEILATSSLNPPRSFFDIDHEY